MTNQERAVAMAGKGFEDFTPEQMTEILESAELSQGFPITRANVFQMRLNGARVQRRTLAEVAAHVPTAAAWIDRDHAAVEFTEAMYGSARETGGNDQPDGYMGD